MPGENQASDAHSGGINNERHPRAIIFRRVLKEWQAVVTVLLGCDTPTPVPGFLPSYPSWPPNIVRLTAKLVVLFNNIYCFLVLCFK